MLPNGNNPNGGQPLQYGAGSPAAVSIPNDTKLSIPTVTADMSRNNGKIGPNHDLNPSYSPDFSGLMNTPRDTAPTNDNNKFWAGK